MPIDKPIHSESAGDGYGKNYNWARNANYCYNCWVEFTRLTDEERENLTNLRRTYGLRVYAPYDYSETLQKQKEVIK